MKPLVMHASNASRWNDSTKASTSAVANDAPCCTMHVPAVICKRMLEVEVPPEPGLADAPRVSDIELQGDQGVCSERFVHKRVGPRQWRA